MHHLFDYEYLLDMIDRCYIEITNVCNLSCDFCPKHNRKARHLSAEEFDLITDKLQGRATFLYFHLMGEPMLHPLLPQFVRMARAKGFKTVLTSNGTLPEKAMVLLDSLPHKVQLSLHSHAGNGREDLADYVDRVMQFATRAAEKGTCVVLRLWNQGGHDDVNEELVRLLEQYVSRPWRERPDGFRMCDNLYLEFDRKFQWPEAESNETDQQEASQSHDRREVYCKALIKQIGVLADGTLVPCCLDHNGDVSLGNLFTQSLDEILASERAVAMLDGFERHYATEALCRNCESALVNNSFRGKARKSVRTEQ